jgi:hypothetical protein
MKTAIPKNAVNQYKKMLTKVPVFITEKQKRQEHPELKDVKPLLQPSWFRKVEKEKGLYPRV